MSTVSRMSFSIAHFPFICVLYLGPVSRTPLFKEFRPNEMFNALPFVDIGLVQMKKFAFHIPALSTYLLYYLLEAAVLILLHHSLPGVCSSQQLLHRLRLSEHRIIVRAVRTFPLPAQGFGTWLRCSVSYCLDSDGL